MLMQSPFALLKFPLQTFSPLLTLPSKPSPPFFLYPLSPLISSSTLATSFHVFSIIIFPAPFSSSTKKDIYTREMVTSILAWFTQTRKYFLILIEPCQYLSPLSFSFNTPVCFLYYS
jgi:hypothetical protein